MEMSKLPVIILITAFENSVWENKLFLTFLYICITLTDDISLCHSCICIDKIDKLQDSIWLSGKKKKTQKLMSSSSLNHKQVLFGIRNR